MPKLDRDDPALPRYLGGDYPAPFDTAVAGLRTLRLGGMLADFGVSLVTVPPGAWSSQRHWHPEDDEFVWIVSGALMLVEEGTRTPMAPGDCAIFPKASANGHHLVNESAADATLIAVGANRGGTVYPDIDLRQDAGEETYRHKDGTAY